MHLRALVALLAVIPVVAFAQIGRAFVALESYVALGDTVRVGKIVKLEPINYGKQLTGVQAYGKTYGLTFEVAETIRGKGAKQVTVVLALQNTRFLEFMLKHGSSVLMVGGPNRIDDDPSPEVGIDEDGKQYAEIWYQFRFLEAPSKAEALKDPAMANQINITFNEGKMFTIGLKVVKGRNEILKRLRAFAKNHTGLTKDVWLRVPNEFGQLVGYSNAYCGIKLPVCQETEQTLVAILRKPGLIFNRIKPQSEFNRNSLIVETLKCLTPFPSKANAELVRKFVGDYDPSNSVGEVRFATATDIQKTAWELLKEWQM